ncbi:DUF2244 domain-containing protein [Burkholderia gladioli]|uniref:DUF2244 domain-containing protein n=1 Tax=Burkholderia gladioli TaxID=28095 RepID=UPI00163F5AA8|nr:DUF2244 domain-containing protein [Burkholderia gladioli]MDN7600498.1 DUF2244 domain-containing protein [Burkholderia gladioli]
MDGTMGFTDTETVLMDWLIKRNCSVSPRQFVACYASLAAFSLAIAVLLLWRGAWLVLPFTGVELLAVGVAFAMYARHAVDYERIRLFPHRLLIERMSAERMTRLEFNPRWVRVEARLTPRDPVRIVSRGQSVVVGQHLAQHRRAQFARELRLWLMRCG